jgi:hypothetical protein
VKVIHPDIIARFPGISMTTEECPPPPGIGPAQCVCLSEQGTIEHLIRIGSKKGFRHIINRNDPAVILELRVFDAMIRDLNGFIRDPVSVLLQPPFGLDWKTIVQASSERSSVLSNLKTALQGLQGTVTVVDAALRIVDELLTNALFNGPVDSNGVHLHREWPRTRLVTLPADKPCRIRVASDKTDLAIICEDPFGSFNFERLFRRFSEILDHGIDSTMSTGPGGSGFGLFSVINIAVGFYVGVIQGSSTVMCCRLPLGKRFRVLETMDRSIHFSAQGRQ